MFINKKAIIIFIILALLIFSISGVLIYFSLEKKLIKVVQPGVYSKESEVVAKAIKQGDAKDCDGFKDINQKDQCIYAVVISTRNISFCNTITDSVLAKRCLEYINMAQFITASDAKRCVSLTISELKGQCLAEIFRKQSDLKFCASFEGDIKALCEDLVNINIAYNTKDIKICDKIKTEVNKTECINYVNSIPKDSDNDGVPDYSERINGTDPFNPESK